VFTSPHDDHIDKQEFLERCFPTAGRLRSQQILQLVKAGQDGVFVMYGYELESGERYPNTDFITVRTGRLVAIQVFVGAGSRSADRAARGHRSCSGMGDPATEGIGLDRYHGAVAHPATVPQARRTDAMYLPYEHRSAGAFRK